MLARRKLHTFLILLIIFCIINQVICKKNKHKHEDEDDEDEDDEDEKDEKDTKTPPTDGLVTPQKKEWLEGIDFSLIKGVVRPVGSGICKDAKCDGSDNDRCFESCGNIPTPDDIYGCKQPKSWALSFDDGPSVITDRLLDILDDLDVKVTFCILGGHAKKYPDIIKRAYEAGHQIASHTYSHPHLMSLSNEQIVYEIKATEEAIEDAIGIKPNYIRPPYGEADARVKAILKQLGYKTLMWNVDPVDYGVHMLADGGQRIVGAFEKIVSGTPSILNPHNDPGFISLQHDLYNTSIEQIPKIVSKLNEKGYKLLTAAECVNDSEPHRELDEDKVKENTIVDKVKQNDVDDVFKQDAVVDTKEQTNQVVSSAHTLKHASTYLVFIITFTAFIKFFI